MLYTKINSKLIRDINVRDTNYLNFKRKYWKSLYDLGLGKEFLNITPKNNIIHEGKNDKLDFIKNQNIWPSKNTIKKIKRQTIDWEKLFVTHIPVKGLVFRRTLKTQKQKDKQLNLFMYFLFANNLFSTVLLIILEVNT